MFVRIVKMRFHEDKIEAFLSNFEAVKQHIRNFEGNQFLELYQDKNDQRIFFTYSYWENEQALENYMNALALGGTKTLPELYQTAGLEFNFSPVYVKNLMEFTNQELEKLYH